MKKKLLIVIPIVIIVAIGLVFITSQSNGNYIVKVNMVDAKSPDRILELYKDNKKIDFDSIYYLDDVFICNNKVPNAAKSALKNVTKLKVKLKNGKTIKVKVEMED